MARIASKMEDEDVVDVVSMKNDSSIPIHSIKIKTEPVDVELDQGRTIVPSPDFVQVPVKSEPDTDLGTGTRVQGGCRVVEETTERMMVKQEHGVQDVDSALSAAAIQQQLRNVISFKEENSESVCTEVSSIEGLGHSDMATLHDVASMEDEMEHGTENSELDPSRVVVKQQLDDSDEEEDTGEYMVLAEWTDGKLEELGAAKETEDENKSKEKQNTGMK